MTDFDAHSLPHSALLFMATVEEARRTNQGPFRAIAPVFRIALEPQRGQILNVAAAASTLGSILGPGFTHHAVGLSGPSRRRSVEHCLAVLRQHGASILTLGHCLEELSDILNALLKRPETQRFGLTGDAIRADPSLLQTARQVAMQPDRAAKAAGVQIVYFDKKSPLNSQYFPDLLLDSFRNTATWHDQYKTEQRERDAMSIGFIMRRRHGHAPSDVLEPNFVLVTRNSTFTEFSKAFVRRHLKIPKFAAGPAIETKTLAAFVWMRFGSDASVDFPQMHLIAACDRILATNGELLRRAERRIAQLKGQEVATTLLSSHQAVLDLVVSVGGSPDVLDAANGEELIRAFTATAEARGREEERRKAELEKSKLAGRLADKEKRSAIIATDLIRTEARVREQSIEIDRRNDADKQRAKHRAGALIENADRIAWITVVSVWTACGVFGLAGQFFIYQGFDWWRANAENIIWGGSVIVSSFIFLLFSIRFLGGGKIDAAAAWQARLPAMIVRRGVRKIETSEERRRVIEALPKDR